MVQLFKSFSNFRKHLSSVLSYNKKTLILGIVLGLFLCVFSFQSARAADILTEISRALDKLVKIPGYLLSMPIRIPFLFLVLLIGAFGLVSSIIFALVGSILNWLIGVTLSIPVISGWVVEVGFEFTKNFANMLIVLILAFIGLATILKFRDYEAKKILPKLILVALLINFTPVIVGIIVDISNLFTNFFFTSITESGALTSINLDSVFNIVDDLLAIMDIDLDFFNPDAITGTAIPIVVKGIIMILFYNFAALVYFLVFLLFFVRFIILWILVILAPIAFFSQILPESTTVKALFPSILHWNKWWETLIQWAFIGIPLGFFLYLSSWIIIHSNEMPLATSGLDNIIVAIISPIVALFMLIVGIIISVESMPGIAQRIYRGAKGIGKGIGKGVGKRLAKRAVLPIAERVGARIQAWGEGQRLAFAKPPAKAGRLKKWGWALRQKAGTATEIVGREMMATRQESETTDVEDAKKKTKGQTEEKQMAGLQLALTRSAVPGTTSTIIGMAEAMMEDGTLEKAENAGIFGEKEKKKYLKEAERRNRKTLYAYDPKTTAQVVEPERWESAQEMRDSGVEEVAKKGEELQKEIVGELLGKIKPSDIKLMSEKALTNDVVKKAMVDTFNGNQMAEIGKNFGRHIVEGIQKEIEKTGDTKAMAKRNPSLTMWLYGNAAQNVGFKIPGEVKSRTDLRKIVKKERDEAETARNDEKSKMKEEEYKDREEFMFRDYYRKDVSGKKKALIKEIITKEGKTIPPEAEIKRRIGKDEKRLDKASKALKPYRENLKKAGKAWEQANKPMSGDIFKLLEKATKDFNDTEEQVKKTQEAIEKEIELKLKDLWESPPSSSPSSSSPHLGTSPPSSSPPSSPPKKIKTIPRIVPSKKSLLNTSKKFREDIWKDTTQDERNERIKEAKGNVNKAKETFWATNYELTSVAKKEKIPLVILHDKNHYVLVTKLDKKKDLLRVHDPMSGPRNIPLKSIYEGIKNNEQHIIFGGDSDSPKFKEFLNKGLNENLRNYFKDAGNITIDSRSAAAGDEWLKETVEEVTAGANEFYDQNKIKSLEKIEKLQKDAWNCGPLSIAMAEAIMKKPKTTSGETKA